MSNIKNKIYASIIVSNKGIDKVARFYGGTEDG